MPPKAKRTSRVQKKKIISRDQQVSIRAAVRAAADIDDSDDFQVDIKKRKTKKQLKKEDIKKGVFGKTWWVEYWRKYPPRAVPTNTRTPADQWEYDRVMESNRVYDKKRLQEEADLEAWWDLDFEHIEKKKQELIDYLNNTPSGEKRKEQKERERNDLPTTMPDSGEKRNEQKEIERNDLPSTMPDCGCLMNKDCEHALQPRAPSHAPPRAPKYFSVFAADAYRVSNPQSSLRSFFSSGDKP